MSAVTVRIEGISFQGHPGALPLLVNQRVIVPPEWRPGHQAHPAALAEPNPLVGLPITVELSSDQPTGQVEVKAIRAGGSMGSVGDVRVFRVDFAGGTRVSVPCHATLSDNRVGVGTVHWQWQYDTGSGWEDAGVSAHELAITIATPNPPWSVTPGETDRTLPWWEVVRHAGTAAAGAQTVNDAATKLADHTFSAPAYQWGSSHVYATNAFETPPRFDCALFLRLLARDPNVTTLVDCSDLAAALSTFANVLGCNLKQVAINQFMIANPVVLAGHTKWRGRNNFGVHEFTVLESNRKVWDGCLKVSGNAALNDPTISIAAADPVHGLPEAVYLHKLINQNKKTAAQRNGVPGVRPIGSLPIRVTAARESKPTVAGGALVWIVPTDPGESGLRVKHLELSGIAPPGWARVEPTTDPDPGVPDRDSDTVVRALWHTTAPPVRLISCEAYLCLNTGTARLRTQALLGVLKTQRIVQIPVPDRVEGTLEFRFEVADGSGLLGTLLNAVFLVQWASRPEPGPASEVADMFEHVRSRILASREAL